VLNGESPKTMSGGSSPIILYISLVVFLATSLFIGLDATLTHFSTKPGIADSCSGLNSVIIITPLLYW
jgi:hypothetical protein